MEECEGNGTRGEGVEGSEGNLKKTFVSDGSLKVGFINKKKILHEWKPSAFLDIIY